MKGYMKFIVILYIYVYAKYLRKLFRLNGSDCINSS